MAVPVVYSDAAGPAAALTVGQVPFFEVCVAPLAAAAATSGLHRCDTVGECHSSRLCAGSLRRMPRRFRRAYRHCAHDRPTGSAVPAVSTPAASPGSSATTRRHAADRVDCHATRPARASSPYTQASRRKAHRPRTNAIDAATDPHLGSLHWTGRSCPASRFLSRRKAWIRAGRSRL